MWSLYTFITGREEESESSKEWRRLEEAMRYERRMRNLGKLNNSKSASQTNTSEQQKQKYENQNIKSSEQGVEEKQPQDYLSPELMDSVLRVTATFAPLIIEKIKNPQKYGSFEHLWVLWGPPGIGKSTLAKTIAKKSGAKVQFVSCSNLSFNFVNSVKEAASSGTKTVFILDDFDQLFEEDSNFETWYAAKNFCGLYDEYRCHPNLFFILTSHSLHQLPLGVKSRLGAAIIKLPLLSQDTQSKIVAYFMEKYYCSQDCNREYFLFLVAKSPFFGTPLSIEVLFQMANDYRLRECLKKKKDIKLDYAHLLQAFDCLEYYYCEKILDIKRFKTSKNQESKNVLNQRDA